MRLLRLVAAIAAFSLPAAAQSVTHAKQLFETKRYDEAKQEFTALSKSAPNELTPALYLGKIAFVQGDLEESIRQFERCAKIDDNNADCHAWLGNALGNTAIKASKFKLPFLAKRTKKEFDRAVELDPTHVDARWGLLQYYMQAPGFVGGSMEKAREQAAHIDRYSKLRGAYAYAVLAEKDKKTAEAETAWQRAIVAAPDSALGYNGLLNLQIREKRWSEAFATLDRVAQRVPTEVNIPIAIASVAFMSGEQLARGEAEVKKWIASPPKEASVNTRAIAHLRLGNVYLKTGRKEPARAEYEKALGINPKLEEARKALEKL